MDIYVNGNFFIKSPLPIKTIIEKMEFFGDFRVEVRKGTILFTTVRPWKNKMRREFEKWRGPAPTVGYTYDIAKWNLETNKLWACWQAACFSMTEDI